jgi:biotin transporter BioY
MAGHLRIVVAFLWANSLVLEIGLPWLAYLAGWMWPSSLTAGFQTLLIASAFCMHLLTCTQNVHKRTYPYVLGFGFLASTFLVIYVHLKSFADIHDLPYQSMVF